MQRNSEMNAILSVGFTSIQSLPANDTKHTIQSRARSRSTWTCTDPFLQRDMTLCRGSIRETFPCFSPDDWGENATRTFLHSCAQRLGLQRLSSTIAMRVILSAMMVRRTNTIDDEQLFFPSSSS